MTEPKGVFLKNNRSALEHKEFVEESILDLLATNRIKEIPKTPFIVNPLSVSVEENKKRLLDLRHVNLHIRKEKIKFDDWKVMEDFIEQGGFMFKFDIKQGYHHID